MEKKYEGKIIQIVLKVYFRYKNSLYMFSLVQDRTAGGIQVKHIYRGDQSKGNMIWGPKRDQQSQEGKEIKEAFEILMPEHDGFYHIKVGEKRKTKTVN